MKKVELLCITACIIAIFGCKSAGTGGQIGAAFTQNTSVISPNNDAKQDELELVLNVKTPNFIRYWQFELLNEEKTIIKKIGTEELLEKLQKSLFFKKENIPLPEKIIWDGKDNDGKLVKDGKYYFRFVVMDNKKNVFSTESAALGTVFVDTVKPVFDHTVDNQLFSPNGDGNKDQMSVNVTFKEDELEIKYPELKGNEYQADILNGDDKVVKTFKFNDKDLKDTKIDWDGKADDGSKASDGLYSMRITGVDKGGNVTENNISNIVIDTVESPVKVSWTKGIFSPNNDGTNDIVDFDLIYTDKENVVGWDFTIQSYNDKIVLRKISGDKDIKDKIVWDGKTDKNSFVAEGQYTGKLEIRYFNGNISKGESLPLTVDLTPPSSDIKTELAVFSPDDNGLNDKVVIIQSSSDEKTEWTGVITDGADKVVSSFTWQRRVPEELKWDGKDLDGNTLPDGAYNYQLKAYDIAGNSYVSPKLKIMIDTKKSAINLNPAVLSFSPNKDNSSDTLTFALSDNSTKDNPVADWSFSVIDKAGTTIFEESNTGVLPENFVWNGFTSEGKPTSDGEYQAVIKTNSFYGVTTVKTSDPFTVDLTGPVITVDRSTNLFSPDGDGENDTITFSFVSAEDKSGIKDWKLAVINPFTKREFISFDGKDTPKDPITWDGVGKNGKLVESVQDYPLIITATDLVGNVSVKKLDPVVVDLLVIKLPDGRYKIKVSNINFQPERSQMTNEPKNKDILNKLAKAMKKFADYNITIEGYANEFRKGLDESAAEKLALQRAITVSNELIKRGIAKTRLTSLGLGFKNPIIPFKEGMSSEEKEEMAINRRVEFYLSK